MKIALGQMNATVGDLERNVSRMIEATQKANQQGATLIVFQNFR